MGKLCIVSDAEGLAENIIHEQTGWVVPKGRPELLAKQIMEVMELSTAEKEQIRASAVKRVNDQFSIEQHIQEFVKFYHQ